MKSLALFVSILAIAMGVVLSAGATAPANFAGTWELDKAKSQNLSRPWQEAEGVTLTIVQNEKQITLETKFTGATAGGGPGRGMMGPTAYNLDGTEINSETERGKSSTKAAWSKDGATLELNVKRTFTSPNGEATATTNDKLSLSADGKVLTSVRHTESPRGPQDSTLVFNKKG